MVSWLTAQVKTYNEATSAEALGTGEKIQLEDVIDGEKVGKLGKYPVHKFRYAWYHSVVEPLTRPPPAEKDTNPNHLDRPLWRQLNKLRFLDICTGSGNIALSLAGQFPQSECVGIDIDPEALALAKDNAKECGFPNVSFYPCDVFRPPTTVGSVSVNSHSRLDGATEYSLYDVPIITGLYDIIVSNPPYVFADQLPHLQPEVRDWENPHALTPAPHSYGSDAGIAPDFSRPGRWPSTEEVRRLALPFYEKIVKMSPRLLNKNYHNQTLSHVRFPRLVMEIGDEEQVIPICNMINELMDAEIYLDSEEKCRWIVGFERS
jgi:methylase of polypeptide subunit release factors